MGALDTTPGADVIDGRFEIGPVIGRGAMGVVHAGRDLRLGREVAVKLLRSDLAADPTVRSRFEDEARSAAQLSHHAIVTVFDSGEWEGVPYLVMERLPGRTLADEVADGPLSQDRARDVAVDIGGALDAAHRFGVIHRDVKPGNILLTDTGRVKLADFGIAKSTEGLDHTVSGTVIGTPAYLAPERLSGEPATPRSDVYALGVVLYEALTGAKPFDGDTPMAVALSIRSSDPVPISQRLPKLDPALAAVIDGALEREPEARLESAAALVAGLDPTVTATTMTSTRPAGGATEVLPVIEGTATEAMPAPAPVPGTETIPATSTAGATSAAPATAGWWRDRRAVEQRVIVAAVVLILLLGVFVITRPDASPRQPTLPTPTEPNPNVLPAPLHDAIVELEESVLP